MAIDNFESLIARHVAQIASGDDPAHDFQHFRRVVETSRTLCATEKANWAVVMPAAWLHDLVIVPKNDPRRSQASKLSASAALEYLDSIGYPQQYFEAIHHSIEAHSFSAGIVATTLEAKVVQDADRLDGLGAIGIARCFATAGLLKRPFYSEDDPFCRERRPDDKSFTLDHFYAKLFRTAETLQTKAGREEGARRAIVMKKFLEDFSKEVRPEYG